MDLIEKKRFIGKKQAEKYDPLKVTNKLGGFS